MTPDQRQARLRHHMYDTNEGIAEQSERIVALEELCADMWALLDDMCEAGGECGAFDRRAFDIETGVNAPCRQTDLLKRMRELGIEVDR